MPITTTQKTVGGLTAAAIGIVGFIAGATETIPEGESRIVSSAPNQEIVVTKTTAENKEIKIVNRRFDKNTGQEVQPQVIVANTDALQSDIVGAQQYIARLQQELADDTALISGATGDITISTPQYDEKTGEPLEPLVTTISVEEVQTRITATENAIAAVQTQIAQYQALIDEANKIK